MYPYSVSNSKFIEVESIPNFRVQFVQMIVEKLFDADFDVKIVDMNTIRFEGVFFRFIWRRWSVFNMVFKGEIKITEDTSGYFKVSYRVYLTEFMIYSLLFTSIPLIFFQIKEVLIGGLVAIWIVFMGIVALLAMFQFSSIILKTYKVIKKNNRHK